MPCGKDMLECFKRERFWVCVGWREEKDVGKALRSPFFEFLEEIGGAYEIKEFKRTVMI